MYGSVSLSLILFIKKTLQIIVYPIWVFLVNQHHEIRDFLLRSFKLSEVIIKHLLYHLSLILWIFLKLAHLYITKYLPYGLLFKPSEWTLEVSK